MSEKTVAAYIDKQDQWTDELKALRKILLARGLEETIKWGAPCYTHQGQNVVGMSAFKQYFGLWFYLGARLKDEAGVLINAQEGKTHDMRQWRMTAEADIDKALVGRYVDAAMGLAAAGEKPTRNKAKPSVSCEALEQALEKDPEAKKAFAQLTPGRQRDWAAHISDAKRETTREKRLQNALEQIRQGRGLHDKYR